MSEPHVRVRVGGEQYALPVSYVLEVVEIERLTPVPGAPPAVLGVCNLRGQVLPVVDPAPLLGAGGRERATHVVVTEGAAGRAGLAVAAVLDVAALPEPKPATDPHLAGAALVEGDLVGVLDVPSVLAAAGSER